MKRPFLTLALVCGWAATASAATFTVDTVNARFLLDGEPFFPIVTSHQRVDAFPFWADMGCNAVCYIESPNTWDQWTAALEANGLYGFPYGTSHLTRRHPRSLGYYLIGEPDIAPDGGVPPRQSMASVLDAVADARQSSGALPLFLCYEGGTILYHFATDEGEAYYRGCSKAVDFVVQDVYPLMRDQTSDNVYVIENATEDLIDFVDGRKPVGAFIETGRIAASPAPGPTPGEFEAEVWTAVGAGAKMILYFPVAFDPWDRNTVDDSPAMQAKMRDVNALLTGLTAPLAGDAVSVSGFRRRFTDGAFQMKLYYRSHGEDLYVIAVSTRGVAGGYSLEFAWDGTVDIPVMGEDRSVTYDGGSITDAFTDDKTAHVYRLAGFGAVSGIGTDGTDGKTDFRLTTDLLYAGQPLRFRIGADTEASLAVHAADGRLITSLARTRFIRGHHALGFTGVRMPPGVYIATMTTNAGSVNRRFTMVR